MVTWLKVISLQVTKLKTSGIFCRYYYYNVVSYVHIHLVPYNFHCICSVGEKKLVIFEISWNFFDIFRSPFSMCCEEVGNGFFQNKIHTFGHFWNIFGFVSQIPAIRFWRHCTYRTLLWWRKTVENSFQSYGQFLRKTKKSKNGRFLVIFEQILAMFPRSQTYDFDAIVHAGAPLGVDWLC